jgi:VWFA-related protein
MIMRLCFSCRRGLGQVKTLLWISVFLGAIMAGRLSSAQQTAIISVKTEEVRIDMLITENGKPLRGLGAADFEVRDNGVLQKIEFVSFEQMPVSAILVFDMSSSVAGETLKNLKTAGSRLLDEFKREDRAALITFSNQIRLGSPLTADINNVKKVLGEAQANPFGESSLFDASFAGLTLAESKYDRPLVIVFTDGVDTSSWLTDKAVLECANRGNAVVYAVTSGPLPDNTFLYNISKQTGGSLVEVESTRDLSAVFLNILEEFRQRYLLTYSPTGVSHGGWHQLKVRVGNHSAKVLARSGYFSAPAGGKKE